MDHVYELPYMRAWHPSYDKLGGVPALKEIKFSLTSNRGCFGGCSFCALTFHQGRRIQVRSQESIIKEAELIMKDPDLKDIFMTLAALLPILDILHVKNS